MREIGYNKGSYTLKGNHYVSTADGLYMIGKNALQKTGIKVITNSNLAEFMKPGVNPIKDIKFHDSSKTTGIVAGATIGGGINLGSQYVNNGYSFKNLDYTEITINALGGAYGGAASGLFSAIGRGAFVNSSTELYSQLKDSSKDVDKDRVFSKLFLGGTFGAFGNIAGNFGKNIKVGDGDLQTAAEAGASIFTGIAQAAADSMNSKDSKNNKDGQK